MSEIPKRPVVDRIPDEWVHYYAAVAKVAVEALREIADHDGSWADAKTALAKIDASGWIPS